MPDKEDSTLKAGVTIMEPTQTFSLLPESERGHDKDDNDDDDLEQHAFRLVKIGRDVLVYGADDGLLVRAQDQKTIRRWEDDALRAIAVSPNQKIVAVGLDSGEVELYDFIDYDYNNNNKASSSGNTTETVHPFCDTLQAAGDDDDGDAFLSQSDRLTCPLPSDKRRMAPRGDSAVRELIFLNDNFLAIATESGLVVTDVSKVDDMPTYLQQQAKEEHKGSGIKGLAWNASDEILTTVSMLGDVCYWSCPLSSPVDSWKLWRKEPNIKVLKKDLGECLGATAMDRATRPCQNDKYLAIPGSNLWQLVEFKSDPDLDYEELFQTDTVHNNHTVVIRSRDTQWVTTDRDGKIVMWQLESESMNEKGRLSGGNRKAPPTDAFWSSEKLWIVTSNGRLLAWDESALPRAAKVASENPGTVAIAENAEEGKTDNIVDAAPAVEPSKSSEAPRRKRLHKVGESTENDDDDDDIDFSQPTKSFVDDEAMEDNEDDEIQPSSIHNNPNSTPEDATDRGMGDDDNHDDDNDDDENSFDMDQFPAPTSRAAPAWSPPAVEPQAAFAPSSTPLEDPRRFLCWNQVGALSVRETDPGRSSVDIDFTDAAFRRPISFTDTIGFILGSIGEEGAILASDVPDDDDDEDNDIGDVVDGLQISETTKAALKKSRKKESGINGSTIYFRRFETFASNRDKDWYLTLPAGERVLGCATGEGWAAVTTHRRFVRLFTPGGNQGQIFWIEGDPVTMVGRSRFLAVIYHQSSPLSDGTQKMGYTLYDAVVGRVVTKGSLSCLSASATLQWVGFSNDSCLMAMDSDGMLSMLVSSAEVANNWDWMPVLDTMALRKSTEDIHWPIHVSDGKLVCVPLKGGKKYPDVARRPVTTTVGLRLPLARGPSTSTHAVEELSVRAIVTLHQRRAVQQVLYPGEEETDEDFAQEYRALSAQVDKVTLKLFASMVEAGKLERALDLMERLHLERSFDVAMQIADRHRKLVDRIEQVRDRKFPTEEEDEDEEGEYDTSYSPPDATLGPGIHSRVSPDGMHPKRSLGNWESEASRKARRVS